MLTGLFGFPWRERVLEARCLHRDRAAVSASLPFQALTIDRHHPIVPDPDCSCGIYATVEALETHISPRFTRRLPMAAGFVELSGRVLFDGEVLRAQRATILGPLHLMWSRPTFSRGRPPRRVVTLPDRYRFSSRRFGGGEPVQQWASETAAQLSQRYGVEVIGH